MPQLQRPTPEAINEAYRDGYITAAAKKAKMRQLASDNLDDMLADTGLQGVFTAYWKQSMKHVQANWDDLVQIAKTHDPSEDSWKNIKTIGRAMLDQVGILTAPLAAFQEVNGAKANLLALKAGASPGLAAFIGVTFETGSGFLPVGQTMRLLAKGIQKNVPEIAAGIQKLKGGAKAAEAAAQAEKVTAAEKLAEDALRTGLKAEGVQILEGAAEGMSKAAPGSAPDFYASLRAYRREMAQITERKTHAMTLAEADKLGITLDDLRALGGKAGLNEDQIAAYLKALEKPTDEWLETAARVVGGDPDAFALFRKQAQDYFSYSPKFRQAEVTAGRTVEILKEQPPAKAITDMMASWDAESMAKLDIDAATRTMAEDILALADEPGKLKALQVQSVQAGPSWWGQAKEAWRNLLLARPITWTRTFNGNLLASIARSVERETAGWLSIDQQKGVMKGEGMYSFVGQMASLGEAFHAFGDAFKKNPMITRFDDQLNQIPGTMGRLVNSPTGIIAGLDNMFKVTARTGDYYAMAYRDGSRLAENMGLTGKRYYDFVGDYMARRRAFPSQAMKDHAETIALDDTFQSELGKMGKSAQTFLQSGPLYYWFTFFRSGLNLTKWTLERVPGVQFLSKSLYKDILAGGEAADMAIARMTLATMGGQFLYGLHQAGLLTSGGPTEPTLRKAWLARNRPYSMVGADGNFYPYKNAAEPATGLPEIMGDFAEIHNQLDDPTAEQTAMMLGVTLTKDALDNTWWKTFGDIADFLGSIPSGEGLSDKAGKLIAAPVVTVATGGPLGQAIMRANDPVLRETKTAMDQIRNGMFGKIFGYGTDPVAVRDGYGDPILMPQAIGAKWLREHIPFGGGILAGALNVASPFTTVTLQDEKIKKEGDRLKAKLPAFPWTTGGGSERDDFDIRAALPGEAIPVPLTAKQRDRWQVIYRNIIRHPEMGIEKQVFENPDYQAGTWAYQREAFHNYLAGVRDAAKGSLLVEDVELAKKVATASAGRYLPMLQPEQRPAIQAQLNESLDLFDSLLPKERENLLRWGFLESGEERDQQIIRGVTAEIGKPISELNAAARAQGEQ